MEHTTGRFEGRATFIDALRGIAALGVACYHTARYEPLDVPAREYMPAALVAWCDNGWIGVQVFFVISGFVIAYSARNARVTPAFFANYAMRRSIRLDPPYWTTIAFVLVLHAWMHLHLGYVSPIDVQTKFPFPISFPVIGSHLLYLQNVLGYDNLSVGFWTLCIEVQFYLLYIAGLGIAQRCRSRSRRSPGDAPAWGLLAVFGPIALLSLFEWNRTSGGASVYDNDMWIIRFFGMFFLGAAAWWALDGRIPRSVFWLYVAAFAGRILLQADNEGWSHHVTIGLSAALMTGVSTYIAGYRGCLGTWLNYRVLQYLGKISYSLYLIHFPMSHVVKTFGASVSGDEPAPAIAALWIALAVVVSILAAHVMYTFIEAPSVRLAARMKRPERSPQPNPAVSAGTAPSPP